jgi:hypothetical protein
MEKGINIALSPVWIHSPIRMKLSFIMEQEQEAEYATADEMPKKRSRAKRAKDDGRRIRSRLMDPHEVDGLSYQVRAVLAF